MQNKTKTISICSEIRVGKTIQQFIFEINGKEYLMKMKQQQQEQQHKKLIFQTGKK